MAAALKINAFRVNDAKAARQAKRENAGAAPRGVVVSYCFLRRTSIENGILGIL